MGDITKRDTNFEKNEKIGKTLKESFAKMQAKRIALFEAPLKISNKTNNSGIENMKMLQNMGQTAINKVASNKHKKDQPGSFTDDYQKTITPLKEEDKPEDGTDPSAAPVDSAAPTDDTTPPPVDANAPEAGADGSTPTDSQEQLATREFVNEFLKSLPSDQDINTLVDANGIFKTSVNDQHEGQFTIIAFPSTKKVHEVADIVEPIQPEEGSEVPPTDGTDVPAEGGEMAPTDGSAMPPADGSEAPPVEKSEDELKEEEDAMYESRKERERDPINEGKKNWATHLKLMKENASKSEEEKLEVRIAKIKEMIEKETDAEEKEDLKKDLGKAKMALARLTGGKKDKDDMKKHEGKED